jgi:hypothetical protein
MRRTPVAIACVRGYNCAPSGAVSPNCEVGQCVLPANQSSVLASLFWNSSQVSRAFLMFCRDEGGRIV